MHDRGYECFDWDAGNIGKNLKSHNVSDQEAEEAFWNVPFYDYDALTHHGPEKRRIVLAKTNAGRTLFIAYTERGKCVRVISARDMHKVERKVYYETVQGNS